MSEKMKVETVEEFLARGGEIKRYPAVPYEYDQMVHPTSKHTTEVMDLDEGAHYFSEIKTPKKRKKKDPLKGIDLDKLPPEIRKLLNL